MLELSKQGEEEVVCPLCMELLELDDYDFFPCICGYQICRFCWHRIKTDENGLCPACRREYSEKPAHFKPLSLREIEEMKNEKGLKKEKKESENREHLANLHVVQKNLVYVVGLPVRLANSEILRRSEYFGKFGKIQNVVVTSRAGSYLHSASAFITYQKSDDALHAIQAFNKTVVDGKTVKTSLGATKYCSYFIKKQKCFKSDCSYLHALGDMEASFTKEEIFQGKHLGYEQKLLEQLYNADAGNKDKKPSSNPVMTYNSAYRKSSCSFSTSSNLKPACGRQSHKK